MKKKALKIKGKSIAFIDWANIFAQQKKQKWAIDIQKLENFLFTIPTLQSASFFHGTDQKSEKSKKFIKNLQKNSQFEVFTKDVKYQRFDISSFITDIQIRSEVEKLVPKKIKIRKCNFDTEISGEMIGGIGKAKNFLLFSGDGDFKYAIEKIIANHRKNKVYIFSHSHSLGQEIWDLAKYKSWQVKVIYIEDIKKYLIQDE